MGKGITYNFLPIQNKFLSAILTDPYIRDTFYLTGGTALAACYFNHRLSEDIDLFSMQKLDELRVVQSVSERIGPIAAKIDYVRIHDRLAYTITFPHRQKIKVDIVYYPYTPIEQSNIKYLGLTVDSLSDIGVNKLMTLTQRTQSKDYVDLYFFLKKYTVWDLREGVAHKFKMDIEPFYASSLYMNVNLLTTLPVMKKKLTLEQLKAFFIKQAKLLASKMVKP